MFIIKIFIYRYTYLAALITLFSNQNIYANIENCSFNADNYKSDSFNIPQAVTVAVSDKGFNTIKDDLMTILSSNGIDLSRFLMQESSYMMDKVSTEKLVDDPAIQKTITDIKRTMEKYLVGFKLNPHQFSIDLKKVLFLAQWKSIILNIHPFEHRSKNNEKNDSDLFDADLILEASNIKLSADSISITDLENAWLSTWGLSKLQLEMKKNTLPLNIVIKTRFFRKDDDSLGIKVIGVNSNIEKTTLDMDNKVSLIMPEVGIFINDKKFFFNEEQLKKDLLIQEQSILKSIQEAINKNVQTLVPTLLTKYLDKILSADVSEINQMAPPAAPTTGNVNPLIWGIKLIKFSADNGLFSLQFNGLVEDPSPTIQALQSGNANTKVGKSHPLSKRQSCLDDFQSKDTMTKYQKKIDQYDVSFGFKTDFFNKFINISFVRGYIKDIDLDDGDKITLIEQPVLHVDEQNRLKMRISFTNRVKGFIETIAVKNPILMSMDLILDTPIDPKTQKVNLVVKDIDMQSVHVSEDNFRWPFKSKGVKSAIERVEGARKSSAGYVLSEELPIPTDLMGILLETKASSFDKNGYMIFHSNYK